MFKYNILLWRTRLFLLRKFFSAKVYFYISCPSVSSKREIVSWGLALLSLFLCCACALREKDT